MPNLEQENTQETEPGVLPREYTESEKTAAIQQLEAHADWEGLAEFSK